MSTTPFSTSSPSSPSTPSVGLALYHLELPDGRTFRRTAWLDQVTGRETFGIFMPQFPDAEIRYGSPGLRVKGWLPRNYTGAHSTGLNSEALRLAPIVLNARADEWTQADLNFVDGATQHILSLAKERGLLTDEIGSSWPLPAPLALSVPTPGPTPSVPAPAIPSDGTPSPSGPATPPPSPSAPLPGLDPTSAVIHDLQQQLGDLKQQLDRQTLLTEEAHKRYLDREKELKRILSNKEFIPPTRGGGQPTIRWRNFYNAISSATHVPIVLPPDKK